MIDVCHNYQEHKKESGINFLPILFAEFANTIGSPEEGVPYYQNAEQLYDGIELTLIIKNQTIKVLETDM